LLHFIDIQISTVRLTYSLSVPGFFSFSRTHPTPIIHELTSDYL
jgi:hypothetical protein